MVDDEKEIEELEDIKEEIGAKSKRPKSKKEEKEHKISDLPGIGPSTVQKLEDAGIYDSGACENKLMQQVYSSSLQLHSPVSLFFVSENIFRNAPITL